MKRTVFVAIIGLFSLAACGGGANNSVTVTGDPAVNEVVDARANRPIEKPANKPAEKPPEPKPDPNFYKRVDRTDPPGWHRLNKDGMAEMLGHTKLKSDKPSNYEFVAGISLAKEPGPTEPKKEWEEWGKHATVAMLYFIDKKAIDLATAVKDNAGKVAAGVPEPKTEGSVAWTPLQGGEVVLAALNLSHGTYLVIGIVLDTANLAAHTQAIVKWAQDMKVDNTAQ